MGDFLFRYEKEAETEQNDFLRQVQQVSDRANRCAYSSRFVTDASFVIIAQLGVGRCVVPLSLRCVRFPFSYDSLYYPNFRKRDMPKQGINLGSYGRFVIQYKKRATCGFLNSAQKLV